MKSQKATSNEIAVIGELNVDLVAHGLRSEPVLGHEILASEFEMTLGSASAIFAAGITRLGHGVTFVSRVGDDEFGRFCIDALSKKGISTDNIRIDKASKTGATIVLSTAHDRALVTYLGAIGTLSFKDVPVDSLPGHRHLHATSYYLQTALQRDFPRLLQTARETGLTTSFDPNSDPDQARSEQIFEVFKQTDILFLNEREARSLTQTDDLDSGARYLNDLCPLVVIKLGSRGAIAVRDGVIERAEGFTVETKDTTGAGDSFAAGFVHAFLDGGDLKECLTVGNACGALSTCKPGGTNGQPDKDELDEFLARSTVAG
ncbi:MAG TPA: carbohydrate kinase family protein [Pyrinomonadaceae bacterium]|nr:carbohydrate kinase family protein [Pyrinomonadaceae bacterium]